MEEQFSALDSLYEFGMCVYTTSYKDYNFSVTIRNKLAVEEFFHYVCRDTDLKETIYQLLDRFIDNNECVFFKVGMVEELAKIDLPIVQLPVLMLNSLTVEIRALKVINCYHSTGSQITTSFDTFEV